MRVAAEHDSGELVKTLAKHGAREDERDSNRMTPLHVAANGERALAAEALLAAGDGVGPTPLPGTARTWEDLSIARAPSTAPRAYIISGDSEVQKRHAKQLFTGLRLILACASISGNEQALKHPFPAEDEDACMTHAIAFRWRPATPFGCFSIPGRASSPPPC